MTQFHPVEWKPLRVWVMQQGRVLLSRYEMPAVLNRGDVAVIYLGFKTKYVDVAHSYSMGWMHSFVFNEGLYALYTAKGMRGHTEIFLPDYQNWDILHETLSVRYSYFATMIKQR